MHWTALLARRALRNTRVVDDLSRAGCGYNLRGLLASGQCPECGHAVADALFLLREPDAVAGSLHALALSYATLVGGPLVMLGGAAGSRGLLWVGIGLGAVGSLARAVALPDLLRRGGLDHLPVIGPNLRATLWLAIAEAFLATAALVGTYFALRQPAFGRAAATAMLVLLIWPVVMTITMLQLSRLVGMITDLLDYPFVAVELRVHRLLLLGGLAVAGLLLLASVPMVPPGSSIVTWSGLGLGGLIVTIGVGFLVVGLLHAAGAAQRSVNARDDVLEHDPEEEEEPGSTTRRPPRPRPEPLPDIELAPETDERSGIRD